MLEDPIDRAMVEAINHIGHLMGKKTIAEFIENVQTLEALRLIGVDFGQGYGIAKPIPFAAVDTAKVPAAAVLYPNLTATRTEV